MTVDLEKLPKNKIKHRNLSLHMTESVIAPSGRYSIAKDLMKHARERNVRPSISYRIN